MALRHAFFYYFYRKFFKMAQPVTYVLWKQITRDGQPQDRSSIGARFVGCLVYSCHPSLPKMGFVTTCRWDLEKAEWYKADLDGNKQLQFPYKITHFCDDLKSPHGTYMAKV